MMQHWGVAGWPVPCCTVTAHRFRDDADTLVHLAYLYHGMLKRTILCPFCCSMLQSELLRSSTSS